MNDSLFVPYQPLIPSATKGALAKNTLWTMGRVLVVIILIVGAYAIGNRTATTPSNAKIVVAKPYYSKNIDKKFLFPVKDDKGNVVTSLTYIIQSIDLQDQIIVQGQKADSVAGRTFLIINLKIVNSSTQSLQLNTRDFIRISIGNNTELLAPEIHNDPVTIQPISTKYTRLGLPVDDTIKDIKLHVGEINGQKTTIDVPIKK